MSRAHVLVVSENPSMRNVFRLILQQESHYRVTTVGIGDAVPPSHIPSLRPDIVLVDMTSRSREQGWTVVQQSHRSSPAKERPLLLCAPALMLLPQQECWLTQQGIGLLWKPFGIDEVLQKVRWLLTAHHPLSLSCSRQWQDLDRACHERSRGDGTTRN